MSEGSAYLEVTLMRLGIMSSYVKLLLLSDSQRYLRTTVSTCFTHDETV